MGTGIGSAVFTAPVTFPRLLGRTRCGHDDLFVAATAQRRGAILKFGNNRFAFRSFVQRLAHDRSRHVVTQIFGIVIDPIQLIQELSVLRFVRILQHPFDGLANQMSPAQLVFAEQILVGCVVVRHTDAVSQKPKSEIAGYLKP